MGGAVTSKQVLPASALTILSKTSLSQKGIKQGAQVRFKQMSVLRNDDHDHQPTSPMMLHLQDLADFKNILTDDEETVTLNKEKVLELVKWVMRLSNDTHRNKEIVSMFSSCLDGELTFDEFCLMYEEISARVELEHIFDEKFSDIDVDRHGFINKADSIVIMDHILQTFAQIWCSKREIVEMKMKLVRLLEEGTGQDFVSKLELFEIFDGMLVTIRLIHLTKQKMNEFDRDHNGKLDAEELIALADWILKSYDRNAIKVSMEEKIAMKEKILASYDEDRDGIINIRELAFLFESIMEKKAWFHNLNAFHRTLPESSQLSNHGLPNKKANRRRLSVHTYQDIQSHDALLESTGIQPAMRDKFESLDIEKTGRLYRYQVLEVLEGMYINSPETGKDLVKEVENSDWDQDTLDFNEFCSVHEDAKIRVATKQSLKTHYAQLSSQDDSRLMHTSQIETLVNLVLPSKEVMGCTEEERQKTIAHILANNPVSMDATLTKEDLHVVVDDICLVSRLYKNVSAKFIELDSDNSGVLEGNEIIEMSRWILKAASPSSVYQPTDSEISEMKKQILKRFKKQETDVITKGEVALIQEDILKKQKSAQRYKKQVRQLLVDLLASGDSSTQE